MSVKILALIMLCSLVGVVGGGLAWLIVAGLALNQALFVWLPAGLIVLCTIGSYLLTLKAPQHCLAIIGGVIIIVGLTNLVLGNSIYPNLPTHFGSVSTGVEQISQTGINVIFGAVIAIGVVTAILDRWVKIPFESDS